MKKVMFLVAWRAIKADTEWAKLYKRLVPRLCSYDERMQAHRGKGRVLGHIIGRLITLIFALLKKDYELNMRYHLPHRPLQKSMGSLFKPIHKAELSTKLYQT